MRPIDGGLFHKARKKDVPCAYEPKANGHRALVHVPTMQCWNRHGQRMTNERDYGNALDLIHAECNNVIEWLDCEFMGRRTEVMKGCIIILDCPSLHYLTYKDRKSSIKYIGFNDTPISEDECSCVSLIPSVSSYEEGIELWNDLPKFNKRLGNTNPQTQLWEGIVVKEMDSRYRIQTHRDDVESPEWVKHRMRY